MFPVVDPAMLQDISLWASGHPRRHFGHALGHALAACRICSVLCRPRAGRGWWVTEYRAGL